MKKLVIIVLLGLVALGIRSVMAQISSDVYLPVIVREEGATATLASTPTETLEPTAIPTEIPSETSTSVPDTTDTPEPSNCDPSYPTVCIPPPPPDLDCADIPYRRFTVLPPDPHNFDGDGNGVGCESD